MKKKHFIRVIIVLLMLFVVISMNACAYSAPDNNDASVANNETDGYLAKISYHNYTLYGTGHYVAFSLTYDHTYYQKKKSSLNELLNNLKDSFQKSGYSVSVDTYSGILTAELNFETTEDYYKATGYDGFAISEKNSTNVKRSAFYTTSVYTMKTVFVDIDKDYKFVGRLLSEGCTKAGVSNENVRLVYIYGTPYSEKTITSDCDKVVFDAERKIYLHQFIMTVDNCDRTITLTQRTQNRTTWYALSIVAGIVITAVPLTIYIVKKKRKE